MDIIKKIINDYGDEVLENVQRTHAVLLDLAQDQKRDRLLARHFVEAGGYTLLKRAEDYPHVHSMIIRRLREEFSLEPNAAAWITDVFAVAMGLQDELRPWGGTGPSGGTGSLGGTGLPGSTGPSGEGGPVPHSYSFGFRTSTAVAIGMTHTVAMMQDGTVIAHGRNEFLQCDLEDWRHVQSVAAGDAHTIGLTENGQVIAVGRNNFDQCDVGDLSHITSVYAFGDDTICVGQDGTAFACGKSELDLSHFEHIKSIAWHPEGVYGIRYDGRVMMSSEGWEEEDWVDQLHDVSQIISTYVNGSLVLTTNGRVYKMGEPDSYFAQLRDIQAMVDLTDGFAVLRKDGKVRILPYDRTTPRKTSESDNWQDITAIFGKYKRLIGLTSEGRLKATCTDPDWLKRNGSLDFLDDWYPVGSAKFEESKLRDRQDRQDRNEQLERQDQQDRHDQRDQRDQRNQDQIEELS